MVSACRNVAGFTLKKFGAERPKIIHLIPADVAQGNLNRRFGLAFVVQVDRQGKFRQLGFDQAVKLHQLLRRLWFVTIIQIQRFERFVNIIEPLIIGLEVFFAVRQQIATLPGLGVQNAQVQLLEGRMCDAHLTQIVERFDRLPVRALTNKHHRHRRETSQREYKLARFGYLDKIHLQTALQIVGSFNMQRHHTP